MCLNAGAMGRQDAESETLIPTIGGGFDDAYSIRTANTSSNGWGVQHEVTHTLDQAQGLAVAHTLRADGFDASEGGQVAVAFHENQRAELTLSETAGTVKCAGGKPGQGYPAVMNGMQVRRLTPIECERLQGAEDDWTLVPNDKGKPMADGPRYKMLGNSFAVPVIQWIGRQIERAHRYALQEAA